MAEAILGAVSSPPPLRHSMTTYRRPISNGQLPTAIGQNVEAKVEEFCNSMTALRSAEILARGSFRQTHLGNLPPVFVEVGAIESVVTFVMRMV